MTHDPLCPWAQEGGLNHAGECFLIEGSEPPMSACNLIAKVRADTLNKAIAAIQPIWERGKALDDAVFADGWLTCFESCESALETMRGKPSWNLTHRITTGPIRKITP